MYPKILFFFLLQSTLQICALILTVFDVSVEPGSSAHGFTFSIFQS